MASSSTKTIFFILCHRFPKLMMDNSFKNATLAAEWLEVAKEPDPLNTYFLEGLLKYCRLDWNDSIYNIVRVRAMEDKYAGLISPKPEATQELQVGVFTLMSPLLRTNLPDTTG